MKNLFKNLMLVAVAAMGFTACEQVIDDVNATNETFTVNIVGEFADDTRSGFDGKNDAGTGYKSAWDGNETAVFSLDEADLVSAPNTYKDGGNKASFAPAFEATTGSTIYAFSPEGVYDKSDASKCKGGVTDIKANEDYAYVVVPVEQTTTAISVDPAAHILAGKADLAANVNMTFNHVVAYGKMTITNFAGDIDKVEITASEYLAGVSCKYFYNEGKLNNGNVNNVNTITVNNPDEAKDNKVFWFGCAPADLSNGTLTVKVYSGDDTYTKELNITGKTDENGEKIEFKFQQGRVASFGVNMAGVEADVKEEVVDPTTLTYTLVKDVNNLKVGDKVIIVAAGYDVAMSTNQKSSNRGQIAVEKSGNTIAYVDGIQILTLEAGTKDDTFAFNTGSGYLYAASSSSNNLKTQATNNDNSSWTIEIAADGVATIKAQGSYTRNWMRYNDSSKLFSCYGSGQKDICIYKGVEADTDGLTAQTLSFPQSAYTITEDDSFTAPILTGAQTTVTYTSSDTAVATVDANSGAVTVVGTGTTTITASAIEANGYRAAEASYTLTVNPVGGGAKTYTLQFGSTYNSKGQSSYSNSWYVTCDDFIWDIDNANNNNNGWNYIRMGSKNAAYVGKITTRKAMPETIKTVTMTVDAVTAAKINSIKLYVASDSSFTQNLQTISLSAATGDLTFNIPTPTANCFYKIEVDCQKASNGLIQISKVVYTNE